MADEAMSTCVCGGNIARRSANVKLSPSPLPLLLHGVMVDDMFHSAKKSSEASFPPRSIAFFLPRFLSSFSNSFSSFISFSTFDS